MPHARPKFASLVIGVDDISRLHMGSIVTEEDQTLGAESRRKTVFLIADIIHRDRERNWQAVTTEN